MPLTDEDARIQQVDVENYELLYLKAMYTLSFGLFLIGDQLDHLKYIVSWKPADSTIK